MKVILVDYTKKAKEILIMTKNTRHFSEYTDLEYIENMPEDEKEKQLEYVFGTIGSCWEFVDYTFLIRGVTRAFTHQLVRSRHASFAQESLRLEKNKNFKYLATGEAKNRNAYKYCMENINDSYERMVNSGVDAQDARGVLPTNILTNIMVKMNLRTLSDLISMRLCFRTQGEYR